MTIAARSGIAPDGQLMITHSVVTYSPAVLVSRAAEATIPLA